MNAGAPVYSAENLLLSGPGSIELRYDGLGRLRQLTGAGTQRFAYDGLDMIAEYNGADALQRRFVFGPGIDEPLVWYEGSGTTDRRFLHADERGSIVAVSNSSGAMLNINKYDEFGTPGASNSGRFQYTGQAWLSEIGVQYSKARIYAPHLGRFLQTDPIEYAGGVNLYAYVGNDPVNLTDPLGLDGEAEDDPIIVIARKLWRSFCDKNPGSSACGRGRTTANNSPTEPSRGTGPTGPGGGPQEEKPLDPCVVNFLESIEPSVNWGAVRLSRGRNIPGNYTTWSQTQIAVPTAAFNQPNMFILFHEFGHVHAYKMNRLSIRSYIGQAITTPIMHPMRTWEKGWHDAMDHESFANDYRRYLINAYNEAGKPCGEIF